MFAFEPLCILTAGSLLPCCTCHSLHSPSSVFRKQSSNPEERPTTPSRQAEAEAAVVEMQSDASVWPVNCFCMKCGNINIPVRASLHSVQLAVLTHLDFDLLMIPTQACATGGRCSLSHGGVHSFDCKSEVKVLWKFCDSSLRDFLL